VTFQNLVGNVDWRNTTQCALVLENNPVGADSRLYFESFPADGFEESYSLGGYREIAADRMPQPGFVAYRGGNWSAFTLELKFRANGRLPTQRKLNQLTSADLDAILTTMERKVRWCQALAFPLERNAVNIEKRLSRARSLGLDQATLEDISGLVKRNDPPIVLVVFGSFLTLRTYLTGYTIKWEGPFHPLTAQPYGATVTLSFQRLDKNYPTWESIRNSAGSLPASEFLRLPGNVLLPALTARNAQTEIDRANAGARAAGLIA